jgi:hypothetical protein
MLKRILAGLIGAVVMTMSVSDASDVQIEVADVRAQLFYATTGTLSEDITKEADKTWWNTIGGEGDAKEPAGDLLVSVGLKGTPGAHNEPVTITVKDWEGTGLNAPKSPLKRTILHWRSKGAYILDEKTGTWVKPILLQDVTCSPIEISAVVGKSEKTVKLDFACGE